MIRIYLLHETSFFPLCTYSSPSKVQLCICIVYISRYVLFIPVYCNSEVVQNYSIKLQEKRGLKTEEMQVLQEKVIRPFATVSKKNPKTEQAKNTFEHSLCRPAKKLVWPKILPVLPSLPT